MCFLNPGRRVPPGVDAATSRGEDALQGVEVGGGEDLGWVAAYDGVGEARRQPGRLIAESRGQRQPRTRAAAENGDRRRRRWPAGPGRCR